MKKLRTKPSASQRRVLGGGRVVKARRVPTVLHIDDDPNDIELFQAAARRANVHFLIQNVTDGDQAMAYLNGRGIYASRRLFPLPVLILLDLKMPRATGFDVLRWIRGTPEAANLPVLVFSGSELQDDIQQAFAVGANSYLVKPIGFNALVDLVKCIDNAWICNRSQKPGLIATLQPGRGCRTNGDWFDGGGANPALP